MECCAACAEDDLFYRELFHGLAIGAQLPFTECTDTAVVFHPVPLAFCDGTDALPASLVDRLAVYHRCYPETPLTSAMLPKIATSGNRRSENVSGRTVYRWLWSLGDAQQHAQALPILLEWHIGYQAARAAWFAVLALPPRPVQQRTRHQRLIHLLQLVRGAAVDAGMTVADQNALVSSVHSGVTRNTMTMVVGQDGCVRGWRPTRTPEPGLCFLLPDQPITAVCGDSAVGADDGDDMSCTNESIDE